jgi:methyl-accepting chemotaxis protein
VPDQKFVTKTGENYSIETESMYSGLSESAKEAKSMESSMQSLSTCMKELSTASMQTAEGSQKINNRTRDMGNEFETTKGTFNSLRIELQELMETVSRFKIEDAVV